MFRHTNVSKIHTEHTTKKTTAEAVERFCKREEARITRKRTREHLLWTSLKLAATCFLMIAGSFGVEQLTRSSTRQSSVQTFRQIGKPKISTEPSIEKKLNIKGVNVRLLQLSNSLEFGLEKREYQLKASFTSAYQFKSCRMNVQATEKMNKIAAHIKILIGRFLYPRAIEISVMISGVKTDRLRWPTIREERRFRQLQYQLNLLNIAPAPPPYKEYASRILSCKSLQIYKHFKDRLMLPPKTFQVSYQSVPGEDEPTTKVNIHGLFERLQLAKP